MPAFDKLYVKNLMVVFCTDLLFFVEKEKKNVISG